MVVLGPVSSNMLELESQDELVRRIGEAVRSSGAGTKMTREDSYSDS